MMNYKKIAAIALCVSVVGCGCYMTASGNNDITGLNGIHADNEAGDDNGADDIVLKKMTNAENPASETTVSLANNTAITAAAGFTDVSDVAEAVLPSIVAINVEQTVRTNIYGRVYEQNSQGSGSGIIIAEKDGNLLIATNNHVVDGADTLNVEFADGESEEAKVIGQDSASDLAVVAVSKSALKQSTINSIAIIRMGNSDESNVGEMVVAIGNALGYGQSVTVGYVSAKDRTIDAEKDSMALIQTDAAINPGNSGGALVNLKGELIGINSAKFASDEIEGMGFAIPITKAKSIIERLSEDNSRNISGSRIKV